MTPTPTVSPSPNRSFYVATTGSDSSGDGSSGKPWATINHADSVIKAGDMVHVAAGTYRSSVHTTRSGTAGARITFVSDTTWGAKIQTTGSEFSWTNDGDYVDIQGFDITGDGRIGILNNASYVQVIGNHIHDIPIFDPNGGAGIDENNYSAHGNDIIGNVIDHIGTANSANYGKHGYGIYLSAYGGNIYNNIIGNCARFGIHTWHNAQGANICNNLVFKSGDVGIIIGSGDTGTTSTAGDYFIVNNNIILYNNGTAIVEEGQRASHNVYVDNLCYGNTHDDFRGYINEDGVAAPLIANPLLVNYQDNGTGDYHLTSGSPAINAGTSQGAPATDIDGVSRPQGGGIDIGPYERAQ